MTRQSGNTLNIEILSILWADFFADTENVLQRISSNIATVCFIIYDQNPFSAHHRLATFPTQVSEPLFLPVGHPLPRLPPPVFLPPGGAGEMFPLWARSPPPSSPPAREALPRGGLPPCSAVLPPAAAAAILGLCSKHAAMPPTATATATATAWAAAAPHRPPSSNAGFVRRIPLRWRWLRRRFRGSWDVDVAGAHGAADGGDGPPVHPSHLWPPVLPDAQKAGIYLVSKVNEKQYFQRKYMNIFFFSGNTLSKQANFMKPFLLFLFSIPTTSVKSLHQATMLRYLCASFCVRPPLVFCPPPIGWQRRDERLFRYCPPPSAPPSNGRPTREGRRRRRRRRPMEGGDRPPPVRLLLS